MSGASTLTLSSNSTGYTGTTLISNGTLDLALSSTGVSFASPITVNPGATLEYAPTASSSTTNAASTTHLSGALVYNAAGAFYQVLGGAVTASAASTIDVTATFGGSASLYFDGGLQGSSPLTVTSHSNGIGLVLRNTSSTYSGTMIVNGTASTTLAASGLAIGPVPTQLANANLTINGTLELGSNSGGMGVSDSAATATSVEINSLNGTGVVIANMPSGVSTRGLSVGNANGSGVFSGIIANGFDDTLSFTKAGTGSQTLSGANTFSGLTTITGGTLVLSGTSGATSGITISGGTNTTLLVTNPATTGSGEIAVNAGRYDAPHPVAHQWRRDDPSTRQ